MVNSDTGLKWPQDIKANNKIKPDLYDFELNITTSKKVTYQELKI